MTHACVFVCVYVCVCVCVCVCVGGRGGGLASVSGPMCMFVFVIRVTARRFSLPLRTKIKS